MAGVSISARIVLSYKLSDGRLQTEIKQIHISAQLQNQDPRTVLSGRHPVDQKGRQHQGYEHREQQSHQIGGGALQNFSLFRHSWFFTVSFCCCYTAGGALQPVDLGGDGLMVRKMLISLQMSECPRLVRGLRLISQSGFKMGEENVRNERIRTYVIGYRGDRDSQQLQQRGAAREGSHNCLPHSVR